MFDDALQQALADVNLTTAAAISVLIALLLLQRQRRPLRFLIAAFYLIMAYGLITGWLARSGLMDSVPFLLYTTHIISFTHGPVLYLYTERLLSRTSRFRRVQLLMFLPAVLMTCVVAVFHLAFPAAAAAALANRSPFPRPDIPVMFVLCSIADFSVVLYLVIAGFKVRAASRIFGKPKARGLLFFFSLYIAAAVTYLCVLIGHMLNAQAMVVVSSTANGLSALAYFLYVHQSPEITQRTLMEPNALKATIDESAVSREGDVMAKLDELMTRDKAYLDPDLNLSSLSGALGINTGVLSHLLNSRMGTNFRAYVNSYRIEEAKRILAGDSDSAILDVAFRVGFNSKSTFNATFSRAVGIAPKEYRKKNTPPS